ncbi:MAG: hypothetical protein AAF433_09900 [Bacteroidota bacterium]
MKQDLLYQLTDRLNRRQVREFGQWLANPLHCQREELDRFFSLLVESRRELGVAMEPQEIWRRLWPQRDFHAGDWRQLRHRLLKQLEGYLAYEQQKRRPYEQRRQLLTAYRELGLDAQLRTRLNRYRPDQQAGLDRYYYEYRHEIERYRVGSSAEGRRRIANIGEQESQLERYILAMGLRQACTTLAHRRMHQLDFELPLLPYLLQQAAQDKYRQEAGVRLFYLAVQLYLLPAAEAEPYYRELRQGLIEQSDQFPPNDQHNLLILALNHGLRESNAGREAYLKDTLELQQFGLQQGSILEAGQLSTRTFNNIVAVAIRLGETQWATSFLDKYEHLLPATGRSEITSLARARIALLQEDYSATLGYLQEADYQDFYHHMTARVLQLKVYFARDNYNLISSHLRASRSFLRRRRQTSYHQSNYSNIFRLAQRITRLPPRDRAAQSKVREEIVNTEPCTERPWLLSVLEK